MKIVRRLYVWTLSAALLVVAGGAAVLWWNRPAVSAHRVREVVYTTLQREAPESFYVTGRIDLVATAVVEDTRVLFPGLIDLSLGTTRATVRVPGRISYGMDLRGVRPDMIRVDEAGVVDVTLPELSVYSVEPVLSQLEVETSVGWARTHAASGQEAERLAILRLENALRQQGILHLQSSVQPRVHTAEALEALLAPVLRAAGVEAPRFRFRLGRGIVMDR